MVVRRVSLGLAAVVGSATLVLGSFIGMAPASAAPSDEIVYGTAQGELHVLDTATDVDQVLPGITVQAPITSPFTAIAVSRDGTKIAWVDTTSTGSQLRVYDRGNETVVTVYDKATGPLGSPVWLADGSGLVVAGYSTSPPTGQVYGNQGLMIVHLDGSLTQIPGTTGGGWPDLSPGGGQLLFSKYVGTGFRVYAVNLDGSGLTSQDALGTAPHWSHDGRTLLTTIAARADDGSPLGSVAATYSLPNKTRTLIQPTYRYVPNGWIHAPHTSWSPDDTRVLSVIPGVPGGVVTAAADGSGVATRVLPADVAVTDAAWAGPWSLTDSTAPGARPPVVTLGATSVGIANPGFGIDDPDGLGIRVGVNLGLTSPATPQAATWSGSLLASRGGPVIKGLSAGKTYSYTVWYFDTSGNTSYRQGHFTMIAAPTVSVPAVASSGSAGGYIPVTWNAKTTGVTSVVLSSGYTYTTPSGSMTSAMTPPGASQPVSGTWAYGKGGVPEALRVGATYVFQVGARDKWGNTRWDSLRYSTVPYDDRNAKIAFSGAWTRVSTTGAWLATSSVTSTGGRATITVPVINVSAKRFYVVASRGPTNGSFKVFLDGSYKGTFSTRAAATALRQVVWTSPQLASGQHVLTIVQVAGTGSLRLDAVGAALRP
jgi:hypothetical protein